MLTNKSKLDITYSNFLFEQENKILQGALNIATPFWSGLFFCRQLLLGQSRCFMYEVKVFDNSGNLKKTISIEKLAIRSQKILDTPSIFKKFKKGGNSWKKSEKVKTTATTL